MKASLIRASLLSLMFSSYFITVRSDEDAYSFGDFAVDVGTGLAVSACEKDPECSERMPAMVVIIFIITGIMSCCSSEDTRPRKKKDLTNHAGGLGFGYAVGRTFF